MNISPNILNITYTHRDGAEHPTETRVMGSICEICLLIQALDAVQVSCQHKLISSDIALKAREFRLSWINRNRKEEPAVIKTSTPTEAPKPTVTEIRFESTPELNNSEETEKEKQFVSPITGPLVKETGSNTQLNNIGEEHLLNTTFSPTQWRSLDSVLSAEESLPNPLPLSSFKLSQEDMKRKPQMPTNLIIFKIQNKMKDLQKAVDELAQNQKVPTTQMISPKPRRALSSGQLSTLSTINRTGRLSLGGLRSNLPRPPIIPCVPKPKTPTAATPPSSLKLLSRTYKRPTTKPTTPIARGKTFASGSLCSALKK